MEVSLVVQPVLSVQLPVEPFQALVLAVQVPETSQLRRELDHLVLQGVHFDVVLGLHVVQEGAMALLLLLL